RRFARTTDHDPRGRKVAWASRVAGQHLSRLELPLLGVSETGNRRDIIIPRTKTPRIALSMNRPLSRPAATLSPPCGERAGRGVPIWFMVPMHAKNERGLSMNRPLTTSLSPSDGERVAEGRVRGGSWSQCERKSEWNFP